MKPSFKTLKGTGPTNFNDNKFTNFYFPLIEQGREKTKGVARLTATILKRKIT